MPELDSREAALFIAGIADDRKALDVRILDIRKITLVADYFVIASGPSRIRVKAIAEAIESQAKQSGLTVRHREGHAGARWILLDYGPVVVHVFHEEERKFYDLERLWGDAVEVSLAR